MRSTPVVPQGVHPAYSSAPPGSELFKTPRSRRHAKNQLTMALTAVQRLNSRGGAL